MPARPLDEEVKVGGAIYGRLQAHRGAAVRLALVKADLNECQILLRSMAVAAEIGGAFARNEMGLEESVALSVACRALGRSLEDAITPGSRARSPSRASASGARRGQFVIVMVAVVGVAPGAWNSSVTTWFGAAVAVRTRFVNVATPFTMLTVVVPLS